MTKFLAAAGAFAFLTIGLLQGQVVTATYTVVTTLSSAALTTQGDNGPTIQKLLDEVPSGAVVTVPAGDWPITTDLKFTKPLTFKLAAGARLYNGAAPPPIDPPPPPIDPPPPPDVKPEGRKAWLRWERPAEGIQWIGVKYSSGGYTSPEMWMVPEGAQELAVLAKPGVPFTATLRTIGVAGATSARVTGVWQIPAEGQPAAPTVTSTTATVIPAPTNLSLTME